MAIHTPGEKFRYHKILSKKKGKRDVTAVLSLTAMVDMFTVLVVFLLQNYNTKDFIVRTPEGLTLPQAQIIKELKPSLVVSVTDKDIQINEVTVVPLATVKDQKEWMIEPMYLKTKEALEVAKEKMRQGLLKNVRAAVRPGEEDTADPNSWRKVTIQADKTMDFITLKKIMYTITEAGAGEINFAVVKRPEEK